jgi:retron-type reverse transcriptase
MMTEEFFVLSGPDSSVQRALPSLCSGHQILHADWSKGMQESCQAPTKAIRRIAERAKRDPQTQFTSLAHLITVDAMKETWRNLKKKRSAGIDGVTVQEYGRNLESNLQDLHERLVTMKYRAQPVKRVYVPKEDGKRRPAAGDV